MTPSQQNIFSHHLSNGMTIVGEVMPWLESAAFSFSVPAGCQYDDTERLGLANFVCDMVQRGCGELDSRAYIEKLESLGIDYSSTASVYHTHFSGAMPSEKLYDAFAVYADMLQRPWLPEDQVEDGRQVCFQEVRAIEDDLAQRVMLQIRLRQYGEPRGRWSQGSMESVSAITHQDIKKFYEQHYRPNRLILSVAGNIQWEELVGVIESLFSDWNEKPEPEIQVQQQQRGIHHIPFESQQSHIGVACTSIPYSHPDYFLARGAVGVLSDGMSSRLFSEIREKRGLCYSVFASLHSITDDACVVSYVGTGADRAQESLDALIEQLVELRHGIEEDELDRLKVQIRSSLIMQQESSRSRASAIAGDWFHLGRARTLDEVNTIVSSLTVDQINQFVRDNPMDEFNVVTLGPEPLELKDGVSPTSA